MIGPRPHLRAPSPLALRAFLAAQQGVVPPPGSEVSLHGTPPRGFRANGIRARVGAGERDFAAGLAAVRAWAMFEQPWLRLQTDGEPAPERMVAVAARTLGLWWYCACRVRALIDEPGPPRRAGFVYVALPAHAAAGAERFVVELAKDGLVWFEVHSWAKPHLLARLGQPLFRAMQRRFVGDAVTAVRARIERGGR